jgi:hypothetical protein
MGSGAGEATKPSKDLIREMVAALTFGPVHARGWRRGDERVDTVRRGNKVREEKCIVGIWKNLGMWICTVCRNFFLFGNVRYNIIYVSPV